MGCPHFQIPPDGGLGVNFPVKGSGAKPPAPYRSLICESKDNCL